MVVTWRPCGVLEASPAPLAPLVSQACLESLAALG